MRLSTSTLLISGLAAQQVTATWDRYAPVFKNPTNCNNECTDKQKSGYGWGDLPTGNFDSYDDFNFSGGWTCANSFNKRDALTKRTFNSKCAKTTVSKSSPASFSCSKSTGFSVDELQVSVEFDCNLEFHYGMEDGSTCKQVSPCQKEGTTVKNTQCGGAKTVQVYLGDHGEQGKDSCEIGLHYIGFNCDSHSSSSVSSSASVPGTPESSATVPVGPTTTPSIPESSSTVVVATTSAACVPGTYGCGSSSASVPGTPESSSASIPGTPESSSASVPGTPQSFSATAPVETTTPPSIPESSSTVVVATTSVPCVPGAYGCQASSASVPGTPESSAASVPGTPESSAASVPGTPESSAASVPGTPESTSTSTPSAVPTSSCPGVLPKCMNTWITTKSQCKDNTDFSCYCKNADFTKSVIECVSAWGADSSEVQAALSYLVGICAPFVPQNPGLITNCPSTVTLGPTPAETPAYTAPAAPATTLVVITSFSSAVIPGASTLAPVASTPAGYTAPGGTTIVGSSITSTTVTQTVVTVPQVAFTTNTNSIPGATATQPAVNLAPGTPAAVYATATSSFGTIVQPYPTGNGTITSPSVPQFTGAASALSASHFAVGAIGAVMALFVL
ncbi:uncharacterized protein BDZ99DRAFT_452913 [Mytilinidion resinicola]|uniref:CFEM domain-containing protein n=1 Tax=Mytilinidion resinicola TaxID=574789 RepID=A0A6A6Y5J7_9PEZI|nr:uncharacterized protein BDZ99DRAFT_452913 [Mytilinidion resinicola]KAF2803798.1 hypothetical protein BDZ99DRAFT_452913 [Mytilinidion resinicola]